MVSIVAIATEVVAIATEPVRGSLKLPRSSRKNTPQKTKAARPRKATKRKAIKKPATKKKTGRPTKRTPDVEKLIIKALGVGLSYEVAADFAGIHRDTLLDWRRKDEAFSAAIKGATARGKVGVAGKLMELIRSGNVAATIFWLKTRTEEFREIRPDKQVDTEAMAGELEAAARAMRATVTGPEDGYA